MEVGTLGYHFDLAYARRPADQLFLPRVALSLELDPGQAQLITTGAILDTGAQASVFDGNLALDAGWSEKDIVGRARDVVPVSGFSSRSTLPGYLHEVTAYFGSYTLYAELKLRVLITPPNRLEFSVLGRSDFFEQVNVTFAERDKRLYFRFRDPSILHSYG
jgi:hypothetical protein